MKRLKEFSSNKIFIAYSILIIVLSIFLTTILGYKQSFFLIDDGYLRMAESILNGGSIFNQYRPPLFPLLLIPVSISPDEFEGYIRLFITLFFVYMNIIIARKIFEEYSISNFFNLGLILALFNPLHIHFTLKSTPHIYITTFTGLIVMLIVKYFKTTKIVYLAGTVVIIFIASNFKPVFSLVPIPLVIYSLFFYRKFLVSMIIVLLFSLGSQLIIMNYTRPLNDQSRVYGTADLIAPYYLPEAMMETGKLEFGSNEELQKNKPNESNLAIAMTKYKTWLNNYQKKDSTASLFKLVAEFVGENPMRVVIAKALAPVFFFSLASSENETLSNLLINFTLLILAGIGINEMCGTNRKQSMLLLSVLLGYFLTYFIAFSYARYSLPVLFFLSFFATSPLVKLYKKLLLRIKTNKSVST